MTADIYKGGIKLGSGTLLAAAASITSYTATNSRALGTSRNVQVHVTGGTSTGVFNTRVTNDGGSTVTIADLCPFA